MKTLITLAFALTSLSLFAATECTTHEAQVIAKIANITKIQDVCFYDLEVEMINEHVLCPLTKSEIETEKVQFEAGFHDQCLYRFEKRFTGILVKGTDGIINFD